VLGLEEDTSPLLESTEIVSHAFASGESHGELTDDLLGHLGGSDHVTSLEVGKEGFDISDGGLTISDASGNLSQMVLGDETLEHATNEKDGCGEGVNGLVGIGLDGTDGLGECLGGVNTGVEVGTSGPVSLLLGDVGLDGLSVEQPSLANGLGKSCWLGEDLSPGLNSGDVLIHALAGGHGGAKLVPDGTGLLDSLEELASLEVTEGDSNVSVDLLATLVASLNLGEVVVSGHTVHETGNEVGDGHDVEGGGGSGSDSGSSESFHSGTFCFFV